MNDFSLIEKIDILMKLVSSSSLFLFFSMISIVLLVFLIICIISNKKVNKWVFVGISVFIGILILINYGTTIFKILDKIIDTIFMAVYFPNLPIYVGMLLIANVCFVISVFSKNDTKFQKIVNIINSVVLDFLLILIIDVVTKNSINIYEEINLYTNSTLLVLLQLSIGIFISWLLLMCSYTKEDIEAYYIFFEI